MRKISSEVIGRFKDYLIEDEKGVNTTRIYTMESGNVHRRHIQKLGLLAW